MKAQDKPKLARLVADVSAFYRQDFSDFAADVWLAALDAYEFKAVADAFNRHAVNTEAGRFMPKPADIVRMLAGSTQDAALQAWAKVDRAVRTVGTYRSVVFDDALIHRVLTDMGGWALVGMKDDGEWPHVRNEFVNRYRGFRERSDTPDYPRHLVGMAEANNAKGGFAVEAPMLVGDPGRARDVYLGGSRNNVLAITNGADLLDPKLKRLGGKRAA